MHITFIDDLREAISKQYIYMSYMCVCVNELYKQTNTLHAAIIFKKMQLAKYCKGGNGIFKLKK